MAGFYERAGEAREAGAPIGAAVDIAKSTTSLGQAKTAGQLFGPQEPVLPAFPAPYTGPEDAVTRFMGEKVAPAIGSVLHAASVPLRKVGNYYEAADRTTKAGQDSGTAWREFLGSTVYRIPGVGFLDPEFRDQFDAAEDAQASVGQTLWLSLQHGGPGDDSSYGDTYRLLDDQAANTRPAPTQDNPYPKTEREEYFGSGWAKWTTGTFDAGFSLFADPLIIGGKGVSTVNAAQKVIKASDVAAAASGATNLTRGGRAVSANVDRIVDASETIKRTAATGAKGARYNDLANHPFLAQSADAGAIPAMLRRADAVADDAERIALKKQVMYAGMGDREALAALEQKHTDLALELQSFNGPNRDTAIAGLLGRQDFSHLDNLRAVDEDAFLDKVVASHTEEVRKTMDALERTHRVGAPSGMTGAALAATAGTGDIARMVKVGKTIHRGSGLPPVHVLFGRKLPGTMRLSADDAYTSFNASLDDFAQVFKGDGSRRALDALRENFALAHGAVDAGASRSARKAVLDQYNRLAEKALVRKHGAGDPDREAQVLAAVRGIRDKRTAELAHIRERSYQAKSSGSLASSQTEDGVFVWHPDDMVRELGTPVDASQFDDLVSMVSYKSIDHALTSKFKDGLTGYMAKAADGAWHFTDSGLSAMNDLWKFGALFRLGYPLRNQVDTQARMMVMLGPMRVLANTLSGAQHMLYNSVKVPASEVEHASQVMSARLRLEQIADLPPAQVTATVVKERDDLVKLAASKPPTALVGEDKARRRGTELARYLGKGEGRGNAYRSTAQVQREVELVDARDSIMGLVTTSQRSALAGLRQSDHVQQVNGSHPLWVESYARMVNNHVRNSQPMMMLLSGADDAAVAKWYTSTDVGRAQWAGFTAHHQYDSPLDLVRAQREQVETLVPEGAVRSHVMGGPLSEAQAKSVWASQVERPSVPAQMLDKAETNPVTDAYNWTRSRWFKWASEIPETMLGRHPFYVDRKQMHLQRLVASSGGDADTLTLAEYNALEARSRVLAQRDVSNYLFDTSQKSNLAHHMRFLSPFYSAWSDTMRKWARISGENLEVLPIIPKVFMAPNAATLVLDDDGNRILSNGDVVDPQGNVIRTTTDFTEGNVIIPIPDGMADWLHTGDAVKVSKGSLNVIFQGDPFFLPGPGPLASIAANKVALNAFPEAVDDKTTTGAVLRYLLPFGVTDDDTVTQALPAWAKNLRTAVIGNTDDDRFSQVYAQLMAEEANRQKNLPEDQRDTAARLQEKVNNRTRQWFVLKFLGSEAPFSTQPTGRLDYYKQEFQRYRRQYGADAQAKFFEDYPDYFEMSVSLSANEAGLAATDDSWTAGREYLPDIKANPDYGWLYVGAANLAPGFDQGVYTAQKSAGLRGTKNPVDAFNDLQVTQGWSQYQKVAGAIQLKLDARKAAGGSASLTANANADLKALKDKFVGELTAENSQWADAYEAGGGGQKAGAFLRAAAQAVADHPELAKRSDFKTLDDYLLLRRTIQAKLAERGVASLNNEKAADLKEIWDSFTAEAVAEDLGFQQMYNRGGLDRDDLSE